LGVLVLAVDDAEDLLETGRVVEDAAREPAGLAEVVDRPRVDLSKLGEARRVLHLDEAPCRDDRDVAVARQVLLQLGQDRSVSESGFTMRRTSSRSARSAKHEMHAAAAISVLTSLSFAAMCATRPRSSARGFSAISLRSARRSFGSFAKRRSARTSFRSWSG